MRGWMWFPPLLRHRAHGSPTSIAVQRTSVRQSNILRRWRQERLSEGRRCLGGVGGDAVVPVFGSRLYHYLLLCQLGFLALAPQNKVETRDDQHRPDDPVQLRDVNIDAFVIEILWGRIKSQCSTNVNPHQSSRHSPIRTFLAWKHSFGRFSSHFFSPRWWYLFIIYSKQCLKSIFKMYFRITWWKKLFKQKKWWSRCMRYFTIRIGHSNQMWHGLILPSTQSQQYLDH